MLLSTSVTDFHDTFSVITHTFFWTCLDASKSFFSVRRGVKPETLPHSHPFSSELTAASSSSLSHNSSLLVCLCCTFILFVVTFPRPSHLSTWKTLMCLQRDIKASHSPQHSHWLFRFMALFFPLETWKTISVSRTDVCAWTPMHVMHICTLSPSHSPISQQNGQ